MYGVNQYVVRASYGTLAKELGAGPEAARDVGEAISSRRNKNYPLTHEVGNRQMDCCVGSGFINISCQAGVHD